MTRAFYIGASIIVAIFLSALVAAAHQLIAIGSPSQVVVEYNAFETAIKISSKVDFANTRVTFDDTPGQYVTVAELRAWVKARPSLKTPEVQ